MSESARTFTEVTAQALGPKYIEWLRDLEEKFGDGRVTAAMLAERSRGIKTPQFLYRVRDRLALEDARSASRQQPMTHLEGQALMALVRGQVTVSPPFTYDPRDLTREEYTEVLVWADRRRPGGPA